MSNIATIRVLNAFSADEICLFNKFIRSEYVSCPKSVLNYYDVIRRHHALDPGENLTIEKVFSSLYPDKSFRDNTIRRLDSDLKKFLDRFILDCSLKEADMKPRFIIAEGYIRRGLQKEAMGILDSVNAAISGEGVGMDYVSGRLEIEDVKAQLAFSRNKQSEALVSLSNKNNYLIYQFIIKLAYSLHDIYTNRKIFNTLLTGSPLYSFLNSVDFNKFSKEVLKEKSDDPLQNAIRIYVAAILNYLNPDSEKYYLMLKGLLGEVVPLFNTYEMYNIYQMAEAICWMKMETVDRTKYRRELFELNKLRLSHGIFSPDGKQIRILLFRQIFMNALQLKEITWAAEFTSGYISKLPESLQKVMKSFCEAHILFECREFPKSLALLGKLDFALFTLKYDYRNLLLRIYVELEYIEEALSLIDSYRHFIFENKNVSGYYKTLTEHFLFYCKHILESKTGKTKTDTGFVRKRLDEDNTVNFKNWIAEKLTTIINNQKRS